MQHAQPFRERGFLSHPHHHLETQAARPPPRTGPNLALGLNQESSRHLNNWIEVSELRLAANFQTIQTVAGAATTVLAVIKANAYGHGAEICAPILARAGAPWLGVTCASEGVRVRHALTAAGIDLEAQPEILIMCGFLPGDADAIRAHRLTPVLWNSEQIAWLTPGEALKVHIEVDTGMGRQGVTPGPPFAALLDEIHAAGLVADGVFTHFSSSEVAHSPLTATQQRRFETIVDQCLASGLRPTWLHAGNTSAVDHPTPSQDWIVTLAARIGARPMVRTGLALYGHSLPIEGGTPNQLQPQLQPVLTWRAHVLAVRDLAPGETVGYNATFTASHPMRVALIPVGYADGLRRELSSPGDRPGGWFILLNQRAPILGRISMNLTVIDVTQIPGVRASDHAIILGPGITAEDHAHLASTIAYEILCGIHPCG